MSHPRRPCHAAFSLVELSLVIVIIGLLVGGILAGESIIQSAKLRSVITDFERYKAATLQFRDQYNGLPGDIPNATAYWGTMSGGCPGGAGSGTQTCDGNGNGAIDQWPESMQAWRQLANAGLVTGSFNGIYSNPVAPGTNVAKSRINSAGFSLNNTLNSSFGDGGSYPCGMLWSEYSAYHAALMFGGGSDTTRAPIISPAEAASVDSKMDDGAPNTGTITASVTANCANVSCAGAGTPSYALATSGPTCALMYQVVR